jgi:ADP-ribose pyrophosphatase YjhB (NUDIX family)
MAARSTWTQSQLTLVHGSGQESDSGPAGEENVIFSSRFLCVKLERVSSADPEVRSSLVSVDVLALCFDRRSRKVSLGVARRGWEPFQAQLALPGVLLGRGERLNVAAVRALTGKLGTRIDVVIGVGQVVTFDEPNRDPRGPTLSVAMWAVVGETAGSASWVGLDEVPSLAFDHNRIVRDCRSVLARELWRDPVFSRALTGRRFPTADAVDITGSLTGRAPDRGNLNRTLRSLPGLARTEERISARSTGRPSAVWEWAE